MTTHQQQAGHPAPVNPNKEPRTRWGRFLRDVREAMPWNRPTLADLPLEERRRIKMLMLMGGAGLGGAPALRDGKIVVHHEHVSDERPGGAENDGSCS